MEQTSPPLPLPLSLPSFNLYVTGKGIPTRHVLGKSKMILGLLEGIPTMLKGEVAVVIICTLFIYVKRNS